MGFCWKTFIKWIIDKRWIDADEAEKFEASMNGPVTAVIFRFHDENFKLKMEINDLKASISKTTDDRLSYL